MNMNVLLKELKVFYAEADNLDKIIIKYAGLAAASAATGSVIPILALPAMIMACLGLYGQCIFP